PVSTTRLHDLLAAGWIRRFFVEGKGLYRFRYTGLKQWICENTPTYMRIQYQLMIANHCAVICPSAPSRIAEHYFDAENRLHGCEYAALAARKFKENGFFEAALYWYRKILDEMPDRNRSKIAQVSYEIAQIFFSMGDFNQALQALEAAEPIMESRFHQKREKANYLMMIGLCCLEQSDALAAKKHLEDAMIFLPKTTGLDYRLKIVTYLSRALTRIGSPAEVIGLFQAHQKVLPLNENPYFAGDLMASVAGAYLEMRDYPAAEFALKESIHHGEMLGDPLALIDRYLALGNIYEKGHKLRQAEEEYERVITLARRGATRRGLAKGICHLASLRLAMHQMEKIDEMLVEAQSLAESIHDPGLIAWSNILQSSLYIEKGRLDEADTLLVATEGLIHDDMDLTLANRVYLNRAEIARRQGNLFGTLDHYDKLLNQVRRRSQETFVAFAYLYKAQVHVLLDHISEAADLVGHAREILDRAKLILPDCDILEAHILLRQDQVKKARKLIQTAMKDARDKNLLHQQAEAHFVKGLIDLKENQPDSALSEWKASLDFYEAGQEEFEAASVRRHMAQIYDSLGKTDRARAEHDAADKLFKKLSAFFYVGTPLSSPELTVSSARGSTGERDLDLVTAVDLIHSLVRIPDAYDKVISIVLSSLGQNHGLLFTIDVPSNTLILLTAIGMSGNSIESVHHHCSTLLSERKLTSLVFWDHAGRTEGLAGNSRSGTWIVPINRNDHLIGIMTIEGLGQVENTDRMIIDRLANLVSSVMTVTASLLPTSAAGSRFSSVPDRRSDEPLIDRSPAMKRLTDTIPIIAHALHPILIMGPEGSGKSFLAAYLHHHGRFSQMSASIIPCQSISAESHVSQVSDIITQSLHPQNHHSVYGGTVILKDIDALSQNQQDELQKLLAGSPEGESQMLFNRRVITTTTVNLRRTVQQGQFNEALYRLLAKVTLNVPPLSDRREDIPYLAQVFLSEASRMTGRSFSLFSPQSLEALMHYDWPKHVAELREAVEQAVLFGTPPRIETKDLPRTIRNQFERSGILEGDKPALRSLEEVEEAHIRAILNGTNGNKLRACEILEVSRPTLDRKLEKFNIKVEKKRKR
ncbi:sigma 54-interacting transcriptional regulator, partial [bacterium]|nr:sigma 54-interacting transcriptional regulator [candidate division CSSED10-310 bacterium]